MHTAINKRVVQFTETFYQEAEKLRLLEWDNVTVLNTASAQLLSLA